MKIHSVRQGTSIWRELRAGIPTASCFDKIITPGGDKGPKPSSSQDEYMQQLLAERILGEPLDGFQSQAMADGNHFESNAVAAYELDHGCCTTVKIGFVTTDDGLIGCSPDRFIEENPEGLLEAKSPTPTTHVGYLLAATGAGKKYKVQLQGQLWVCEKEWVDIISYCAGMPDAVFRVTRDEVFIKELAAHVRAFSGRLEEKAADFAARGWIKPKIETTPADPFLTEADAEWARRHAMESR